MAKEVPVDEESRAPGSAGLDVRRGVGARLHDDAVHAGLLGASKRELGLAQHVERIRGAALGLGDTGADPPCDRPLDDAGTISAGVAEAQSRAADPFKDRKRTRLKSSHDQNSYALFCLKKRKT